MYIFGLGSSGVAAVEMQIRFLRYETFTNISDSHFQTLTLKQVKDVVVIISLLVKSKRQFILKKY